MIPIIICIKVYFLSCSNLHPEDKDKLSKLKSHLIESSNEMAPLKVWQLQHLSMQAAQRIMTSSSDEEMLSVFVNTAQNFPSLARTLTITKVKYPNIFKMIIYRFNILG